MDHLENRHWVASPAPQRYPSSGFDGNETHNAKNYHVSGIKRQRAARKAQPTYDPKNISAEEILYGDPDLVRRDVLLRVAEFYSNTEIFQILNANRESRGLRPIKSANNITKMLTAAVHDAAARIEGATAESIRLKLKEARKINQKLAPRVHEFDFRRNVQVQQESSIMEQPASVLQQQQLTEALSNPAQTMCHQPRNFWNHVSSECFVPSNAGFSQPRTFCQYLAAEQQQPQICQCFEFANHEASRPLWHQTILSWSDYGYDHGTPEYVSSNYPSPDAVVERPWEGP